LKPSTKQRFVAMSFNYPAPKDEIEILINETEVDKDIAKKLVAIGNKIRNLTDLGLTETASTRLLVDAAKLIQNGLPKRLSVHVAVVEPLSDEPETIQALKDLCDLMI
ncbi:MAG: CbbQ/NirQ/NorQ C-terminal domain-containing protein, partial [Chitinophagales bacterium]|nr:CbbQ/NirQ/NorQ C-terminal domain-containing protein [Chitinophagales bacterium]